MITPEQEQLYAQCLALPPEERPAFVDTNRLSASELFFYKRARKGRPKRSSKQQRKVATVEQKGICTLCQEAFDEDSKRRIDHATGKALHVGCQLGIASVRKMIADGITLDCIADFLQILRPAPPVDPFDPQSPEL